MCLGEIAIRTVTLKSRALRTSEHVTIIYPMVRLLVEPGLLMADTLLFPSKAYGVRVTGIIRNLAHTMGSTISWCTKLGALSNEGEAFEGLYVTVFIPKNVSECARVAKKRQHSWASPVLDLDLDDSEAI